MDYCRVITPASLLYSHPAGTTPPGFDDLPPLQAPLDDSNHKRGASMITDIKKPDFDDSQDMIEIELAEDQARERSERRDYENEVLENKSELE